MKPSIFNQRCSDCGKEIKVDADRLKKYTSFLCDDCKKESKQKKIMDKIRKAIPKKFQNIETDQVDLLNKLYSKSVFFTGSSGIGKSVLMASIIKKYIRDGVDVKWIKYPTFIKELQNAYIKEDKINTAFDIAKRVAEFTGVLAIDDIGISKQTDFVKGITYYLINEREVEMLPTIITSNYSLSQLSKYIDDRISSRIAGMCEVIKLTGVDRRLSK